MWSAVCTSGTREFTRMLTRTATLSAVRISWPLMVSERSRTSTRTTSWVLSSQSFHHTQTFHQGTPILWAPGSRSRLNTPSS